MAYHVYTTRGIILGAYPSREADRVYSILSEDLGLIRARARSARSIQSKLRGSLEPFSLSSISLVRGQEVWRITGAVIEDRLDTIFADKKETLLAFARVFSVVEKLVQGEEKHPEMYTLLAEAVHFVKHRVFDMGEVEALEIFMLLSVLHELGYLSERPGMLSEETLQDIKNRKKELILTINHGLKSSHLT